MLAPPIAVLRDEGHEIDSILRDAGVSSEDLVDPTRRITIQTATRVWQAALREVPDPNFGLRAAVLVQEGDADVLSCLTRSCSTLEEALRFMVQFGRLIDETLMCSLRRESGGAFFSLGPRSIHYLPAVAEYANLRLVLLGRRLLGGVHHLLEVRFAHRKPSDVKLHRELFRATLRFDQKEMGLLFESRALTAPIPSADPVLKGVLIAYAQQLLDAASPRLTTAQRVRDTLVDLLPSGFPSRAQVAQRLGISERALARSLVVEDTNFKALVDELRIELAFRHLQDGRVSIGGIAAELGFQDQSAFTKFFKRCSGMLPLEYRRRYQFRNKKGDRREPLGRSSKR
jgi:AraC-like DNA-binding protein